MLINPTVTLDQADYFEGMVFMPPLGLAYLASVLTEAGHQVLIVDRVGIYPMEVERRQSTVRCGLSDDETVKKISSFAPELVGITCPYTANAEDALASARLVKSRISTSIPILMGGAHASVCPEELLETGVVDFVAIGEGEGIIMELCDALEASGGHQGIAGLLFREQDGSIRGIRSRKRIEDLDTIPFPRRDLLPLEQYFEAQRSNSERINNIRWPKTTMITSRGCPENCVFCAIRSTWGRKWVGRSPENIVDEIESLIKRYGVQEIDFLDDSISVSRERLERTCNLLLERGIDIKWTTPNGIAIWSLDEALLILMKRAGCYRLTFGLESGDPETIKFIRKRYTPEQALRLIRYANRIGLWTIGTFILGFPYETAEQMENTIKFAVKSGVDLAIFYCASPFPGTDLYEICKKEGIDVPRSSSLMLSTVDSLYMDTAEIAGMREEANARFVSNLRRRPYRMLWKIRDLEDLRYTYRVGRYGIKLLRSSTADRSTTSFLYDKD